MQERKGEAEMPIRILLVEEVQVDTREYTPVVRQADPRRQFRIRFRWDELTSDFSWGP